MIFLESVKVTENDYNFTDTCNVDGNKDYYHRQSQLFSCRAFHDYTFVVQFKCSYQGLYNYSKESTGSTCICANQPGKLYKLIKDTCMTVNGK